MMDPPSLREPRFSAVSALFALGTLAIMVAIAASLIGGRELQSRAVRIVGIDCARSIGGSGALVGGDLVLTSGHVVVGADELVVRLDTGEELPGEVVHVDRQLDVAVMRVPGLDLPDVTFGDAESGDAGVVAILGGPDAESLSLTLEPYVVRRWIRATTDNVGRTEQVVRPTLEIESDIERGDSGAMLFDRDGTAVGLIWSTSRGRAVTGYAVRGSELPAVLEAASIAPSGPGSC